MIRLIASIFTVLLAGLSVSACKTDDDPSKGVSVAPQDCPKPGPGALIFWDSKESVVPGQTVALSPFVSSHPGSREPLPSACLKDVGVRPETAGRITRSRSGNYRLEISEAPPLGERITVSANYRGKRISGTLTAFDPGTAPLVRYWRQEPDACPEGTAIQELVFSADGTFSVTWEPFETYKDYWGRFEYDQETQTLTMMPRSGNNLPDGVTSGTIRLENEQLILGSASFGARYEDVAECRAPFN